MLREVATTCSSSSSFFQFMTITEHEAQVKLACSQLHAPSTRPALL
jgi:hypothetical protein